MYGTQELLMGYEVLTDKSEDLLHCQLDTRGSTLGHWQWPRVVCGCRRAKFACGECRVALHSETCMEKQQADSDVMTTVTCVWVQAYSHSGQHFSSWEEWDIGCLLGVVVFLINIPVERLGTHALHRYRQQAWHSHRFSHKYY